MAKGILSITFDDGSPGWMLAADVLEQFGFRGTFNATIHSVMKTRQRFILFPEDRIIHEDDLRELQKRGHEIASHGLRHVNLPSCNDVELIHELKTSKEILESLGLKISTFSCSFNASDKRIRELVLEHYESMRGNTLGFNALPFNGRIYKTVGGGSLEKCKQAIDRALKKDLWAVLLFHNVKKGGTGFDTSFQDFNALCRCAKKAGIPVKNVSEVIRCND